MTNDNINHDDQAEIDAEGAAHDAKHRELEASFDVTWEENQAKVCTFFEYGRDRVLAQRVAHGEIDGEQLDDDEKTIWLNEFYGDILRYAGEYVIAEDGSVKTDTWQMWENVAGSVRKTIQEQSQLASLFGPDSGLANAADLAQMLGLK